MMRRTLLVAAVFLAGCSSLFAQSIATSSALRPVDFALAEATPNDLVEGPVTVEHAGSFRALNNVWYGRGPLLLGDGRFFSFPSAFGWIEGTPTDFLPSFNAVGLPFIAPVRTLAYVPGAPAFDLSSQKDWVSGEVSFFYGSSLGGRHSREVKAGSILGQIAHGDTQITVGASYGQSNGRRPVILGH
ncbi:MAG TPA: hypothetical protein VGF73_07410 [Chthoniobacterales bacterium]|jgi:hypothetical protein